MIGNPFDTDGRWYKSALHVHTTDSDGRMSPEDTLQVYAEHGYDLVCFTDHDGTEHVPASLQDTIAMPGAEVLTEDGTHIVALGLEQPGRYRDRAAIDGLFARSRRGEIALFMAHPYWSHLKLPGMMAIDGLSAVEVYNTTCDRGISRGFSEVHWDDMLDLGRCLWVVAVDDCHHTVDEVGRGWTMLRLRQPTRRGLVEALHNGWCYASTGIVIHRLIVEPTRIRVVCDPVARISFLMGPGAGVGQTAYNGVSPSIAEAAMDVPAGFTGHVRVQCVAGDGRRAWTNPFRIVNGRFEPWSENPYLWKRPG